MSFRVLLFAYTLFWTGCFPLIRKEPVRLVGRSVAYGGSVCRRVAGSRLCQLFGKYTELRKRALRERELSEALAYVQNIVTLGRDRTMSRELLLEELADLSDNLQKVFWEMAHRLRLCEDEAAGEIFYAAFGLDYARDVAKLFTEWERIPPREMLSTVEAYRDLLFQKRRTLQKKKDEWISDLAYFPVVLNCMVVLLNFIYVAYFIEQRELLMGIL
ncbi:MAG: hypothetical protein PHH65_09155 [Eubacteriales bacterium]|nr:hypothetical protein [Eubacteriales bacterium]